MVERLFYSNSIAPALPSRRSGFALFRAQAASYNREESSQVACELIANPGRKTPSKPGTGHSGGKICRYEIPNHVLTMGAYPSTKMMTIPTGSTYFM